MHLIMVADSCHREKTLKIEKKNFESRKIMKSRKKIKIEKNILESRKLLQN